MDYNPLRKKVSTVFLKCVIFVNCKMNLDSGNFHEEQNI